jgi:hypothetical protein
MKWRSIQTKGSQLRTKNEKTWHGIDLAHLSSATAERISGPIEVSRANITSCLLAFCDYETVSSSYVLEVYSLVSTNNVHSAP